MSVPSSESWPHHGDQPQGSDSGPGVIGRVKMYRAKREKERERERRRNREKLMYGVFYKAVVFCSVLQINT